MTTKGCSRGTFLTIQSTTPPLVLCRRRYARTLTRTHSPRSTAQPQSTTSLPYNHSPAHDCHPRKTAQTTCQGIPPSPTHQPRRPPPIQPTEKRLFMSLSFVHLRPSFHHLSAVPAPSSPAIAPQLIATSPAVSSNTRRRSKPPFRHTPPDSPNSRTLLLPPLSAPAPS